MKTPTICQIRLCGGKLCQKAPNRLQCEDVKNHSAWLVKFEGQVKWEFTPRGKSTLQGKLLDALPEGGSASKDEKEAKTLKELAEPERANKKARQIHKGEFCV